jgi:hypothetical protein
VFGEDISAYLPQHLQPFAVHLKQFPSGYEKWIYASSLPAETYQGDVFAQIPLIAVDDDGNAVRPELNGMVISTTCDAQPNQGEFILFAPVIDLEDYRQNSELKGEALINHIQALTENKISGLMFLPDAPGIRSSFVDFGKVCPISTALFHSYRGRKQLLSLSQCGHYFLLVKLAYHFCRPDAPDVRRAE